MTCPQLTSLPLHAPHHTAHSLAPRLPATNALHITARGKKRIQRNENIEKKRCLQKKVNCISLSLSCHLVTISPNQPSTTSKLHTYPIQSRMNRYALSTDQPTCQCKKFYVRRNRRWRIDGISIGIVFFDDIQSVMKKYHIAEMGKCGRFVQSHLHLVRSWGDEGRRRGKDIGWYGRCRRETCSQLGEGKKGAAPRRRKTRRIQ